MRKTTPNGKFLFRFRLLSRHLLGQKAHFQANFSNLRGLQIVKKGRIVPVSSQFYRILIVEALATGNCGYGGGGHFAVLLAGPRTNPYAADAMAIHDDWQPAEKINPLSIGTDR